MAVSQHVLTLSGAAQALSTVSGAPTATLRTVSLQAGTANTHAFYIGDANVSATVYGIRVPSPVSNEPVAPVILGETQSTHGHNKLSEWYVIGTAAEKVHLLVVTI
jgi:hypothetical protein